MRTIYDYVKAYEDDYDTCDDVFDETVTISINLEPVDDYDKFCIALCKMVEVKEARGSGILICGWTDFIKRNMGALRKFANENWIRGNYDDDDLFICEWIKEFHLLLAGYGEDGAYGYYKLMILDNCK